MSALAAVMLAPLALFGVSLLAILLRGRVAATPFTYGATLLICTAIAGVGAQTLLAGAGAVQTLKLPLGLPWIGAHFRLDALAGFFLLVLGLGGGTASLFAIGHGRHEAAPERVLPFFPAFIGAMGLVVLAADAFSFLVAWESMSLLSWALVMTNHRAAATRKAGLVYLVMASFGTLSMMLAFGLLAGAQGDYSFAAMRAADHGPLQVAFVLGLMLLGAGSKAGLIPLHVWLPLAHPAAPSHVSALMSGVMTKVAIYGFIRVVFGLLHPGAWWVSPAIILLGGISAALGIFYALMERDLKKVLAYSTIENVGIIFIALGLALAFRANAMPVAAALAFTAALFHILNHALFKSLLFFGAGAILNATGEKDMDKLGGLIHRMPVTAVLFLIGAMAISGLPPLNGFASEWLIFQAILQSPQLPQWGLKLLVPGVGALLALAAALAASCFVRAYGISFLGRARTPLAAAAHEVDRFSLAAMGILAGLSIAAGIFPGPVMDMLSPATQMVLDARVAAQSNLPWLTIVPLSATRSSYNGLLVLLFIIFSASLAAWLIHRLASNALRRAPAWDCGFPNSDPVTQYSADGFSQPMQRVMGGVLFGAREESMLPPPGSTRPARHQLHRRDPVWSGIYAPVIAAVEVISTRLNRLQFLSIRRYLSLVFLSLISLLLVLTLWS